MHTLTLRRNRGIKPRFVCAWLLGLMLSAFSALAADNRIEISAPYLSPVDGVYVLNAQLLFKAPDKVEHAVHDGATLTLELQIKISRSRAWWLDETLAQLQQRYELLYHGVSERYLVRNMNSGAQVSYTSFAEAIESLRHIDNLPILDQTLLMDDPRNEVNLRAITEVRSIPRALGMLLFWVDDFSLESDWYTWPLKP